MNTELAELKIVETVKLNSVVTLWRTNAPDICIKQTKYDEFNETREILLLGHDDVVIERGPTVHKDKVFGGASRIYTSWSSGKAVSVDEIDKHISYLRLAGWMMTEMEMGIG